jgi:ubiquinone biosynthesis protein COQ9
MIQDNSENFEETWKFLDNRFNDIRAFGSLKNNVETARQFAVGSVTVVSYSSLFFLIKKNQYSL